MQFYCAFFLKKSNGCFRNRIASRVSRCLARRILIRQKHELSDSLLRCQLAKAEIRNRSAIFSLCVQLPIDMNVAIRFFGARRKTVLSISGMKMPLPIACTRRAITRNAKLKATSPMTEPTSVKPTAIFEYMLTDFLLNQRIFAAGIMLM